MTRVESFLAGRVIHIFALALVTAAFVLLVIVNTTALTNRTLVLFEVLNPFIESNGGIPAVRFGTFGYCRHIYTFSSAVFLSPAQDTPADEYTSPSIGYDLFDPLDPITPLVESQLRPLSNLTKAMVLHPLAAAFSFLTVVSTVLHRRYVSPVAPPVICGLATLLALIGMICDLALFSNLKSMLENAPQVRNHWYGAVGYFGAGMSIIIAAVVCLFVGNILMAVRWWFGCKLESARRDAGDETGVKREQEQEGKMDHDPGAPAPPYENDVGHRAGYMELSQGTWADRHELNSQNQTVELDLHDHQYYELPVTQPGSHDLEQGPKN
ncbi:pali-domain-containing protein [Annulohypoxylon moriforme]|nr:pali-domain-containing protein [Annulohypoxylon moriforme]